MKIYFMPKTRLGKWSVWLNAFFLIAISISIVLVNAFNILSFNDRWWDVTVPLVFFASITASIFGLIAIKKEGSSALVYLSIIIGLLAFIFILLHSLFIND